MARVFLGRDEVLDRAVAIKVLNPIHGGTDTADRFRREGRTAARLSHPNIVQVYDAGEGEFEGREVSYIVMEYVPGGDLKASIDYKGPLSNAELAQLGAEVSSGLAHAHEKGVIHRDIKPHNILIDDYGHTKLTDFGIARALDATQATRTGSYLGTALYSSPEQLHGERVTPKSDVYSLGMTLYQAAVGEAPFTGTPIEVASQHISRTPPAPSDFGVSLNEEAEALILDCVQKDPDRRPTAEEVHERLLDVVNRAAHPTYPQAPPPSTDSPVTAPPAIDSPTTAPPITDSPATDPPATDSPTTDPPTIERTRATPPETAPAGPPPGGARLVGDRGRWRRGPVLFAAAALLLVALGVAAAVATLGGGGGDIAQGSAEDKQASSSEEEQEASSAGDKEAASAQEQTTQANSAGSSDEDSGDPASDAAQAVRDFYRLAAAGDYEASSSLLTEGQLANTFPSRDRFDGTFGTLESISFVEGPQAEVSGDTATVTGVTVAEHTNRTERNRGTWTLVNQNDEWKISWWSVNPVS
jgi:eukaryotic-like serine/threonine-protein kinase